jgi:hypothetical protein
MMKLRVHSEVSNKKIHSILIDVWANVPKICAKYKWDLGHANYHSNVSKFSNASPVLDSPAGETGDIVGCKGAMC